MSDVQISFFAVTRLSRLIFSFRFQKYMVMRLAGFQMNPAENPGELFSKVTFLHSFRFLGDSARVMKVIFWFFFVGSLNRIR